MKTDIWVPPQRFWFSAAGERHRNLVFLLSPWTSLTQLTLHIHSEEQRSTEKEKGGPRTKNQEMQTFKRQVKEEGPAEDTKQEKQN